MRFLFYLLIFIFSGCDNGKYSFYKYYADGDLYRIPLIKPYILIRDYGLEKDFKGDSSLIKYWGLSFKFSDHQAILAQINVEKEIIYGKRYDIKNGFGSEWIVIIPSEKIEKSLGDEYEWREVLKKRYIDPDKLYNIWSLFEKFKTEGTLPWYNPSENLYP